MDVRKDTRTKTIVEIAVCLVVEITVFQSQQTANNYSDDETDNDRLQANSFRKLKGKQDWKKQINQSTFYVLRCFMKVICKKGTQNIT